MTVDVLVVGDLNPDLVVTGTQLGRPGGQFEHDAAIGMTLGGSGGICAAGLAGLGLRTALCATVGDDDMGRAAQRMLTSAGVLPDAVGVLPGRRTGLSVHLLAGVDRAIYTDRGAMVDLGVAHAVRWLHALQPRHVHICSLYLIPALVEDGGRLVAAAHSSGANVSLDTNFDPSDRFKMPEWAAEVDVLLPNETEALRLTGRTRGDELWAAAQELAADGALVAIKRGPLGAVALHGTRWAQARPGRPGAVVDAVGAGDNFDAGLIRALLDGRELADALAVACACGTLSTRAAGGTAARPSLAEALEFVGSVCIEQDGDIMTAQDDAGER